MLKSLVVDNFKCFEHQSFEFSKINLFAGFNGRGKSTALQAILLISQSVNRLNGSLHDLHIKGAMVDLGGFGQLVNDDADPISFSFLSDGKGDKRIMLEYEENPKDFTRGKLTECRISGESLVSSVGALGGDVSSNVNEVAAIPPSYFLPFKNLQFISADRIGPRKFEEKNESPDTHIMDSKGLISFNTLLNFKDTIPSSMNPDAEDSSNYDIAEAVSLWMSYIMSGGGVRPVSQMDDQVVTVKFSVDPKKRDKSFHSYNVGFGYSYILSIVEAALIAKEGSILIVENPEAHLHGKAQSRLTLLLSKAAQRGVQIFVETHSEHIINGFRLQILRNACPGLSEKDLAIYFFNNDYSVMPLRMEKNGNIKNWPRDFFDQETQDLMEIMKLGALER